MWVKYLRCTIKDPRVIFTFVALSAIFFVDAGFGGSFLMQETADVGSFSVAGAVKGLLMAYTYLFGGLLLIGGTFLLMWKVIAGKWPWDESEMILVNITEEEIKKVQQEVGSYAGKLVIFATVGAMVTISLLALVIKLFV